MKHSSKFLVLATALLGSSAAFAEPQADWSAQKIADLTTQLSAKQSFDQFGPSSPLSALPDTRTIVPNGANGDADVAIVPQINASSDGTRATFRLSRTLPIQYLTRQGSEENWTIGVDTWSFAVSAPIDKSGSTQVASTGGLPSDFLAKFSFTRFIGHVNQDTHTQFGLYRQALAFYKTCSDGVVKAKDEAPADHKAAIVAKCGPDDANTIIPKYLSPQDQAAYNSGLTQNAFLWGFDASAGYQKYDFFDALTAAKANSTGTPWSAGGLIAYSPDGASLLTAAFDYQRSFKAGTTGTLCPAPTPIPPVLTCVTGAIGAPKEKEQALASLEFKRMLPLPSMLAPFGLKNLGLDAKFTYDVKSDVYGFDVPLSFVADDKGNLVGGVEFGWTSDKHEFVAGLFLSSAFSLSVSE